MSVHLIYAYSNYRLQFLVFFLLMLLLAILVEYMCVEQKYAENDYSD